MSDNAPLRPGKISVHGDGVGAPSPELIEQRAREIALIDERDPENYTDGDWDQARRELSGEETPSAPEEIEGRQETSDEHEIVPESTGHRAPHAEEDEESIGERLVSGGLDEAAHDQMLEARREMRDEDEQ